MIEKQIIAYQLADAFPEELPGVVNRAIADGWQPFGNVFTISDRIFQPVVKYASSDNKKAPDPSNRAGRSKRKEIVKNA